MTEHTVTVTETVETDETIYTCDYCGLGRDAGEIIEYEPTDQKDNPFCQYLADDVETIPELHFHVACLPQVVADDEQAGRITLKSQYDRRSGDSLLLVITKASLLFYGVSAVATWYGHTHTGLLASLVLVFGLLFGIVTVGLSYREARNTIKEFNT